MKQTLLVFLAMALFMLIALSQLRATLRYHRLVYGRDVEIAAVDLAQIVMGTIQTRAFDEADALSPGLDVSLTGLTGHIGREGAETLEISALDDIDDFDGISERYDHAFNNRSYTFDVVVHVRNVDPHDPSTSLGATASLAKEVTVQVAETDSVALDRPHVGIRLSRIFTRPELFLH